ncbi:uncharacterized protein [Diadema setosum]|uniref:uncharacterized protein n=1 Tax=Diadema setosum TaxID=31175 RepID=UPI003B3A8214
MLVILPIFLVAAASAELAPLLLNREPIPGKYLVKIRDEDNVDKVASDVRISGGRVGAIWHHVLHGFAAELDDRILDVVRRLPAVEYVEEDGVYSIQSAREDATWGLDRIDQQTNALDTLYSPRGNDGNGWTVWVIDTGVQQSHPDFNGRATQEVGFTLTKKDEDCNGHGTHCAGTVGSTTYGVANKVTIKGVKVLNCIGSGSTSNIVSGIEYVRDNKVGDNNIASMSLGGGASTSLDNAVKDLIANGVKTVVAAGNSNEDAGNTSPARLEEAITVGATDRTDTRSSFSNFGESLDIFAPGTDITSTWNDLSTKTISGTSMACPHVAGALTLFEGNSDEMIAAALDNVIADPGAGSPNKLLYVGN